MLFILKNIFLRVIFLRSSLLILVYLLIAGSAFAQILNESDSVKNIYGPKTTRYFLEDDLLNSIDTLYYLDTVLNAFQRYTFPQKYNYQYQDLGNKGTAIQPLFYKPPSNIGFRSGYNAYDLYYEDLLDNKFYDTKSPFSRFQYVQGGRGVSFLETEISRNVKEGWNLGFTFNRISSNPQIQFDTRPLNHEADHNSYSAYTAYRTANGKYLIDATFKRMNHKVHETGGVQLNDVDYGAVGSSFHLKEFFRDYTSQTRSLQNALSTDLRVNIHLYQQFKFSDLVGLYHSFDYYAQTVSYSDNSAPYNYKFYKDVTGHGNYYDTIASPNEITVFKIIRNDVGLKGAMGQLKYRVYYKRRNIFVDNFRLKDQPWQIEDYGGVATALRFSERSVLHMSGEIIAISTLNTKGNYQIDFDFENKYIKATFKRMQYAPSYIQQIAEGNYHSWRNSFHPTDANDLILSTNFTFGSFQFVPRVKASLITNYIYFDKLIEFGAVQATNDIQIISPGFDLNFKLWKIKFRNSFTYNSVTTKNKPDPIRLPTVMTSNMIYFEQLITKRGHFFQFGFDAHSKSPYYSDNYIPTIQQFYLQEKNGQPNSFLNQYLLVDVYAAMKINRTRVFAKLSNAAQGTFGGPNGYFVRPYYFGFPRVLDVGVHWMFFD